VEADVAIRDQDDGGELAAEIRPLATVSNAGRRI
jgi:hypothetical protein